MNYLRYIGPPIFGLLTFIVALAVSAVVYAQDGGAAPVDASQQALLSRVTDAAFQIIVPIISLFAMWATHRLIGVFEKKTKFDIPDKQERKIDEWIESGIHWAEEKSRSAIKTKANKLKGPEKLEAAGSFVMEMVKARGWIDWSRKKIEEKIEAQLGLHRANGGKPRLDAEDSPDLPEPGSDNA
jgi:hypothetical protein